MNKISAKHKTEPQFKKKDVGKILRLKVFLLRPNANYPNLVINTGSDFRGSWAN